ncbi:MAG: glycosyltransferase family 2 protein [Lachnospiraceae bacterium]|nr:glycosyltransferase family 2 protein [Lachnospiraceae bacterium]
MISVLIPVYNCERYLLDALESVESQSFRNYEAVLVEAGSTDRSASICDSWCVAHSRFKCVHLKNNMGVSFSRNKALSMAEGDMIAFLDADDFYSPDALSVMYDTMERTGADMVSCGYFEQHQHAATDFIEMEDEGLDLRVMEGARFVNGPMLNGDSHCWGKLFKRNIIGDKKFPEDLTIGEDMLFLLSVTGGNKRVSTIYGYKGYGYRTNPEGAMLKPFTPKVMDQITCWERAADIMGHSDRIDSAVVTNAVLTASRISQLPFLKKGRYKKELQICREKIREYYRPELRNLLPEGYPVKVDLLMSTPSLYSHLYSILSKGKRLVNG